jgi:GPH family glycoside/pentoside/hexuronide:cation symporter
MRSAKISQKHDLPTYMIVAWGLGTLPIALMFNTFNALALRYFTDYLGLAAATAGSLIALSKIYDAVTDPAMGWISDRTNTRFGKRRPYLLIGALICALSIAVIFSLAKLPFGGSAIAVFLALILFATGYTVYNVPYIAMPAEMSFTSKTRSSLMSWRVFIIGGGSLVAGALAPMIVHWAGGGAEGHSAMGLSVAAMIAASGFFTYFLLRGAPEIQFKRSAQTMSWRENVRTIFSNRPFAILMAVKLFLLSAVAISASTLAFFTVWILDKDYSVLGMILFFMTGGQLIATPLWLWVYRRIGAKRTFLISAAFFAIISMTWLLADSSEALWITYGRSLLKGLGAGGVLLVGQTLLPDVIEYDRLTTALRREGVLSGIYTTVEKVAFALATALLGVWLQVMHYVPQLDPVSDSQPASAITALHYCQSFFPSALIGIAAIFVLFYSLDEKRLIELRGEQAASSALGQ